MPLRSPAPGTFEIGLVMAGAVSAGAYTAGVLDFLFEALGEWERAKLRALKNGVPVPDHKVVIRAASGASAGGIASALTAMVPFTTHTPIRTPADAKSGAKSNLLYKTWVQDIDLTHLLSTSDVTDDAKVPSLLNGKALDAIAQNLIDTVRVAIRKGGVTRPTWIANPLQLYLSIANMRGVPYLIQMVAADPVRGHRVVTHGDYAHFAVRDAGAGIPEALPIGCTPVNWPGTQPKDMEKHDGWDEVRDAALSTSAFPIGLPARAFRNPRQLYDARPWGRPPGVPEDSPPPTIAPDLAPIAISSRYEFWTVDGGVVNNEPLEFARIALAGAPDAHNPREPARADRGVLMIDPFPDDEGVGTEMGYTGDMPDIFGTAFSLISTMKRQSRFKPEEIMLALHESIYSRFLIAPTREGRGKTETNIASAGLGGFGGFVHEELRKHDFFLGRRNCQQFLRNHLAITVDNPIVKPWVERFRADGTLPQYQPMVRSMPGGPMVRDEGFVQLIPLVGTAAEKCDAPPWPKLDYAKDVEGRLKSLILGRAKKVADAGITGVMGQLGMKKNLIADLLGWFAERKLRNLIRDKALNTIKEDLQKRNLLK